MDQLCKDEYGYDNDLLTLLQSPDKELSVRRLRRLNGVLIKEPYANNHPIGNDFSATKSVRTWDWDQSKLDNAGRSSVEYKLLSNLAEAMPGLVEYTSYPSGTLDDLIKEAESESGLYKVLALYVRDKLSKSEIQSFRGYYGERTSNKFDSLANVASELGSISLTVATALVVGPASIAVPFALIALNYGLDCAFEPDNEKDMDN